MGRTAEKGVTLVVDAPLNTEVLLAQHNQVAVMNEEQETRVRAVAAQIGYLLPADCTSPDLIQRDIASNMRRSVEACLEIGRGLQVLKIACVHGEFLDRLDALSLDRKVAARFMQSSIKFSNVATSRHLLTAVGNQSKLFEMLVLDDEQIEELELIGQTGELSLDDVATMSVKELRKALRETREDKVAQGRVLADKSARIDELATQLARKPLIEETPIDMQLQELRLVATAKAGAAEAAVSGALYPAIHLLMQHEGSEQRVFAAGLLAQVEQALIEIRAEYGIDAAPGTSAVPRWMQDGADDEVAEALATAQRGA